MILAIARDTGQAHSVTNVQSQIVHVLTREPQALAIAHVNVLLHGPVLTVTLAA